MKTIFISNSSWYLFNFRKSTLQRFVELGYEVTCLAPDTQYEGALRRIGVSFETFELEPTSTSVVSGLWTLCSLANKLRRIDGFVFSFTPKINFMCGLISSISKASFVPNISGQGAGIQEGPLLKIVARVLAFCMCRNARYIFFQNADDMAHYKCLFQIDSSRAKLLPGSGVDVNKFSFSPIRKEKRVFGMFSRLLEEKGVHLFLKVAERFFHDGNVEFILGGAVEENRKTAVKLSEISKYVDMGAIKYVGNLQDVAPYIKRCTCIVLPTFYPEGTPKILLEALASGRIILTTDSPGCKTTVAQGKNGYLVEPRSFQSLLDGINKVITLTDSELEIMGHESRRLAIARFDEKFVVDAYEELVADMNLVL